MRRLLTATMVAVSVAVMPWTAVGDRATVGAVSNAHFVGAPVMTIAGDTVTATGKVAGLGQVLQINAVLSGDAACVNRGGNKPQAGNKQTFSIEGAFPVQNGKALFFLALEAVFQPPCNPPMSVAWSDLSVTVTAADGTFLVYP